MLTQHKRPRVCACTCAHTRAHTHNSLSVGRFLRHSECHLQPVRRGLGRGAWDAGARLLYLEAVCLGASGLASLNLGFLTFKWV